MSETPTQPCPYPSCGSSDAFSWNSDGYGKCHSCGKGYPSKEKTFDWAKEAYPVTEGVSWKEINRRETSGATYEDIRSLKPSVAKLYGIQGQTDDEGNVIRYAFKYPTNVKYLGAVRDNGKKDIWFKNTGVSVLDLFGPEFNAGTSKRIYLTEGEFDSASLFQVLGETYPVKSLPSSGIGDKFIKHNYNYLNSFQEIVYAGEQDDSGKKATQRLYRAFPDKFWKVPLSKWKDANEFLEMGDADDLKWAALKPMRFSPDNFFCSDEEFSTILREENPYESTATGHSGIDGMTRGLVKGGVTFWKAPPGTGKTEVMRFLERAMLNG